MYGLTPWQQQVKQISKNWVEDNRVAQLLLHIEGNFIENVYILVDDAPIKTFPYQPHAGQFIDIVFDTQEERPDGSWWQDGSAFYTTITFLLDQKGGKNVGYDKTSSVNLRVQDQLGRNSTFPIATYRVQVVDRDVKPDPPDIPDEFHIVVTIPTWAWASF